MDPILFAWLARVAPVALRTGGLLTFEPFLGDRSIPAAVKAGLLVVLTGLLLPVVPLQAAPIDIVGWVHMALSETMVGVLIGLSMQVVFEAMQLAGQITGVQLGLSLATLFDPLSEANSGVMTVFFNLLTLLIYLQFNVHHWVLRALARSFDYLPVGSLVPSELLTRELIHVVGALFVLGVQIAAPVLLVTMLIDLVIGFLNKASPQLPALLLGIPVKSLTGYALLIGVISLWPGILERRFAWSIGAAEHLLHLAH